MNDCDFQRRPMQRLSFTMVALWTLMGCTAEQALPVVAQNEHILVSLDATGTQDVTEALNAYFRSVPDHSVIQLPAGARYRVEGVLVFENRRGLTIEGNGATILAATDGSGLAPPDGFAPLWPRKREHLHFEGGGEITIRNLTVRGPHSNGGPEGYVESLEAQHAFAFEGVDGVELDHVTATDIYGDFVYLSLKRGGGPWSQNVWIHDSRFERNGRQGITIDGAEDVLIERIYLGEVGRSLIDLEPFGESGGARRVTVRESTFGRTMGMWLASLGKGSNIEDITLENNTLIGEAMKVLINPPEGNRRRAIRILNNTSDKPFGSPLALMRFYQIDGVEVRGNHQPIATTQGRLGVYVAESCDVVVESNLFLPSTPMGREPLAITEISIVSHECVSSSKDANQQF